MRAHEVGLHRHAGDTRQALLLEEALDELVGLPPRVQHGAVRRKGARGWIVRALVEDDGAVQAADYLLQIDVLRRPGKPDPAADAAPGGDESGAVELRDDTTCERVWDEEIFAQPAGRDSFSARPAGQLSQDADCVVCASRDFRGFPPLVVAQVVYCRYSRRRRTDAVILRVSAGAPTRIPYYAT